MIANYSIVKTHSHEFWNLQEVKSYLRISYDYDDELIQNLIKTSVEFAEDFTGTNLYSKKICVNIKNVESSVELKYPNIVAINSVYLILNNKKEQITDKYGYFQKKVNKLHLNEQYINREIEVEYLSGYTNNQIPQAIKQGLLIHVALMYENSEHDICRMSNIKDLYLPYRIIKI